MKMNSIRLILSLLFLVFIASCKHGEYMPDIDKANVGIFTLDENSTTIIEDDNFTTKFNVKLYYPEDKISDARIVGIKNGKVETLSTLKNDIKELPIDIELSYNDFVSAFESVTVGDQIEVGLDIKMGDIWYPAFGFDGKSTATQNVVALPNSTPTLIFKKLCPLVIDDFVGDNMSLEDGFFNITNAKVVKISEYELEIQNYGGLSTPEGKIKMIINPKDYTVTVAKQVITADFSPYHNLSYEGKGVIDTCNGIISLTLEANVDEGTFGSFKFVIKP